MIRRVLVPMDFTPGSEAGLLWAVDLVGHVGGMVHILHVVPRLHQLDPFFRAGLPPKRTIAMIRTRAGERLQKLLGDSMSRCRLHVVEGDPATCILDRVGRLHADLVVVGTHARAGAARLLIGSIAETVIRGSTAPVLTIRHRVVD